LVTFEGEMLLLRFDKTGDTVWTKKLKSVSPVYTFTGFSVKPTNDNGLIICGVIEDAISSFDNAILLKTDSNGNLLWNKIFSDTLIAFASDAVTCVNTTSDNGFIIGYSGYASGMNVIKTDSIGNIEWSDYFAELDHLKGGDFVKQTFDGGYIVTGDMTAAGAAAPYSNIELLKLSANGNLAWIKTSGTQDFDYATSVLVTDDSCFLTCGSYFGTTNLACYISKTNNAGTVLWSNTYSVANADITVYSTGKTSDGGYILCGDVQLGTNYSDIFLLKLQANGNVSWSKSIGGQGDDYGKAVIQAKDGGFIITASDEYDGISVIRTDNSGISGCNEFGISTNFSASPLPMPADSFTTHSGLISSTLNITSVNGIQTTVLCMNTGTFITANNDPFNTIQIYPNPVTEQTILSLDLDKTDNVSVTLYDVTGRIFFQASQRGIGKQQFYFPDNLPKGLMIVKVLIGESVYCSSVVVY
jgi:hypothetical protein